MGKLFWVWAVVVCLVLGVASRASAEKTLGQVAKPISCRFNEGGGHPGLDRKDAFAPGEVVLTFDDGPQPWATGKLLDALDKHGHKAAFFVVGLWVRPDTYHLIQRMVASGHEIGTHTYTHDLRLARRGWGIDYIMGQYELTHILVELALLARSRAEFEELYTRVLEHKPGAPLTEQQVRREWRAIERNHYRLLSERGFDEEHRVYPMLFARPPGGIPYEGQWSSSQAARDEHERALARLGLMNILWHGGSGDTVVGQLDDYAYLTGNVRYHTKKGGILLIHDRMRRDALEASLARMAKDPEIRVTTLRSAVEKKYACDSKTLYASLRPSNAVATRATPSRRVE